MKITYQANGQLEEALGNLSIETKSHSEKSSYLINLIASTIKREFYAKERAPLVALKAALIRAQAVLEDFDIPLKITVRAQTLSGNFLVQTRGDRFGKIKISNKVSKEKIMKKPRREISILDNLKQKDGKKNKMRVSGKVFLSAYGLVVVGLILAFFLLPRKIETISREDILADALQKVSQAEEAISQKDAEFARKKLEEAKDLIGLDGNDQITKEIEARLDKTNKIETKNNLTILLLDFEANDLLLEGGMLYAKKTSDDSPRLINFKERQVAVVDNLPLAWKAQNLAPNKETVFYGTYLYSIKKDSNQIEKQRYLKQDNTLGEKTNWLKEKHDLANGFSLTVDGAIYLGLKDPVTGKIDIKKFFKGEKQEFNLEEITTPPKNPIKLITSDNHEFIYLLEPQRVLVYDKNGNLKIQYLSSQFSNLRAIALGDDDQSIYLLNNNEILLLEQKKLP